MNECIFLGNFVRDPRIVQTSNGETVVNFTLAVNPPYKREKGDKKGTAYIDCEAWEKTAELINKNFSKGSRILVQTFAKSDSWKDETTGAKRNRIKFVVTRFHWPAPTSRQEREEKEEDVLAETNWYPV